MNIRKLLNKSVLATTAITSLLLLSLSGNTFAAGSNPPCYQYNANGFNTSTTPVFNNICGITSTLSSTSGSYPLGDETNFVRIRNHQSDNPLGSDNPPLSDSLTSTCDTGSEYDIWTYIHNDASPDYNNNGTGSAVAHDVQLAMSAPLNSTNTNFEFTSTVSASNAASTVSDSATLMCNGQPVKLTLVPSSVHYNNNLNQTTYGNMPDSAVNGTTTVGSPTWGSGTEWGCWDYRIVVVYTVQVEKVVIPPQVTATCNYINVLANSDRIVTINQFNFTDKNASFKNAVINWGDGSANTTVTDESKVIGQTHTYSDYGTYHISILVTFSVAGHSDVTSGGSGSSCSQAVTFSTTQPPTVTPPTVTPPTLTTTSQPAPTELVNTGPGSVAAVFAGVSFLGTLGYRYFNSRKLTKN